MSFAIRTKEHLRPCGSATSNFEAHLLNEGHTVDEHFNPKILHLASFGTILAMLEFLKLNRFQTKKSIAIF